MRNYKLLQALASILETTNLTESAKQLNVTQSAMSKTLAHIRIEFSDPILIREGNRLVLTERAQQLKAQSSFSLDDLADARHILVSGIIDRRQVVDTLLSTTGKKRKIFAVVPSFLSAVQSLKLTQAIMVTPTHIAAQYVDNYELIIKALPIDIPEHDYYLLWHAKYQNDQEHRWFRELVFPLLQGNLANAIEKGKALLQRIL